MKPLPADPLRAAAYCRVSTDKEDQLNSLTTQRQFFQTYITQHPGWRLVRVFADEGLSGTSVQRPQFAQMIGLALGGEIDLIVTKEVSRFARNTVDTLQVTRRLKEKGVGVLFLNDNIDTRDNDGEFRLTIMASVAQEESRKISERTRWGQLQAMKRGVVFGNQSLYGYRLSGGQLTVEPDQAEVVRAIYQKFLLERKGTYTIARELTQAGVRPPLRASGAWSSTAVGNILRNEKYCGDLLQKKYRTTDYLTHRKIRNEGAEETILLQDHHEAIVSRTRFQAVQEELAKRAGAVEDKRRFSARYWYSGKIRCGACGRSFALKRTCRAGGRQYLRFVCRGRVCGEGCQMRAVPGEVLEDCARCVLQALELDGEGIMRGLLRDLEQLRQADSRTARQLRQALQRQTDRRDRAMEAFLDGVLSRSDLQTLLSRCDGEIQRLRERLEQQNTRSHGGEAEKIRAALEQQLAGGETLLGEVIRRITVCPEYFIVEAAEKKFVVRAGPWGCKAEPLERMEPSITP